MSEIIIFDLEFTTWNGAVERNWSEKDEIREITWIAAIRVDVNTLEELDSFDCVIKPTINPTLSEYFTNLTGLTQQRVDREGISFLEGVQAFQNFVNSHPIVCYGMDTVVFFENFHWKNIKFRARRFDDDTSIVLNFNKEVSRQTDKPLRMQESLRLHVYGSEMRMIEENTERVVFEVDLEHPGQFISPSSFRSFNIRPWFNSNAPETAGKYSGELAAAFGESVTDGNIHEPLFDARSILGGARYLINSRGAENILRRFLNLCRRRSFIQFT